MKHTATLPQLFTLFRILKANFFSILIFIVSAAIIYTPAIQAPFFQDDFLLIHLTNHQPNQSFFDSFRPIPYFPYRPLATHLTFFILYQFFSLNHQLYHLFFFGWFLVNVFLVKQLALKLTQSKQFSHLTSFLYLVSATHYMTLYWIASAYFLQGTTFFLLSFLLFITSLNSSTKLNLYLSLLSFTLATLFNEATISLPLLLLAFVLIFNPKKIKTATLRTIPFFLISALAVFTRLINHNKPDLIDYQYDFNPLTAIATTRWYLLRVFSLPEGINFAPQKLIILSVFAFSFGLLALIAWKNRSHFTGHIRLFSFGLIWFLVGLLPFHFLPNHMSSYYLEIASIGIFLVLSTLLIPPSQNRQSHLPASFKLLISGFLLCFFLLNYLSFQAMKQTHWVSRRAFSSGELIHQLQSQCLPPTRNQVSLTIEKDLLGELPIITSEFRALDLYCNSNHLILNIPDQLPKQKPN